MMNLLNIFLTLTIVNGLLNGEKQHMKRSLVNVSKANIYKLHHTIIMNLFLKLTKHKSWKKKPPKSIENKYMT
jgi:hypothetical protein